MLAAMGAWNQAIRRFSSKLSSMLSSAQVLIRTRVVAPGKASETARVLKASIEETIDVVRTHGAELDRKVRALAAERWSHYRDTMDRLLLRLENARDELEAFVAHETAKPRRELIRQAFEPITAVLTVVADWEANELFAIVRENSLELTESVIAVEDQLHDVLPDVLTTVRANPANVPLDQFVRGEVVFDRAGA